MQDNKRTLVYICSPYSGDVAANVKAAGEYCRLAVDKGYIPVAPHLLYPQFMNDKSGAEKLQGFWIVEIGELAGMKKADIEKVKAFLSTADDKYRPSYGKTVESHPRQCIIIASVNGERGYLRDITGNRRFWIVKLHQDEQKKRWHFTKEERDQIWAEAKAIYESGEKLYLEADMIKEAEKVQQSAMEVDERQGMIRKALREQSPRAFLMRGNGGEMSAEETQKTLPDERLSQPCRGR